MIQLRRLSFSRGVDRLVEGASFQIHPSWKVGLTGANGCGKSSFMALLRGQLHADSGDLEMPPQWVIAHVAQDTPALAEAAQDFVLGGDEELARIEADLLKAEADHAGEQIALLHGRIQEIGGYGAKARAAELLHGLGFKDSDFIRPVAEFSGGWRVRLNLARALMCRSDLLLLDEPTNHLDLDAVLWLENWLKSYQGTLLMISHDRDFLDAVVGRVVHIEQQQMTLYQGNYTAFERTRAERLANQQAMHEKQQREVAHLQKYVDRFRAQATKARQAQSRIKALDRMKEVAAAHVDSPFSFTFLEPEAFSDPLLQLDRAAIGYGEKTLLGSVSLSVRPGLRLGLLGRNGAGKSTLVKCLSGELKPLTGHRTEGRHLRIGYFAQHQLEQLRPDESPLQHLLRQEPQTREQELRDYIGGFDFRGDMAATPCRNFSGGEKTRLALALLIRQRPNLLLLDEPTNHLDLEMREALTLALQETEAAVVLVSHDRHLLRTTCDDLWLVADGQAKPFDGDLDDYARWLADQRNSERSAEKAASQPMDAGKSARKEAHAESQAQKQARLARRRPLLKELEKLEKNLSAWQTEKTDTDEKLADPALYTAADKTPMEALLKRQEELTTHIDNAEVRWLEIQEALETLEEPA
ncbi:MAG: ATP-binding cassette domain-containing protein [Rhodocyclaceae bacterium]|nr:MAG: ATP-binding cassette domain-containing protein [Rhodocyclaceae bacterium]